MRWAFSLWILDVGFRLFNDIKTIDLIHHAWQLETIQVSMVLFKLGNNSYNNK